MDRAMIRTCLHGSALLRTAICDLLGIEYPVMQSGMGRIAGPELVAEVCGLEVAAFSRASA